nr:homocitrate synthase [Mycobacterium sp. 1274761.0]
MDWTMFMTTYAPTSGPLRLGQWVCTDKDCPPTRLGPQPRNYQATLAIGDRIATATASASGPVAALTAMLHEQGIAIEMVSFHQLPALGETATFIRGGNGYHTEWALGLDEDPTLSALRAVIACANRLLSTGT